MLSSDSCVICTCVGTTYKDWSVGCYKGYECYRGKVSAYIFLPSCSSSMHSFQLYLFVQLSDF